MRIFTIISAILLSAAAHAAHMGEVVILSNSGEQFYVSINGNFQNYYPQSSVQTTANGNQLYNFKIVDADNHFAFDKNILIKPNRVITYKVVNQFGFYNLQYFGERPINSAYNNSCNSLQGIRGVPVPAGRNYPSNGCHNGGNNGQIYLSGMSNAEFERLKATVNNQTFSDDKLRVANQAAGNKRMTVTQIKQIAQLFTFSNEKLAFTKAAYRNCVNKANYYEVMDVFTFSSDKKELSDFISANS